MGKTFYLIEIKRGSGLTDFYDREIINEEFLSLEEAVVWIKKHPHLSDRNYPKNKWWWFCISKFSTSKTETLSLTKFQRISEWFGNLLNSRYERDWMITKAPPNGTAIIKAEKSFFYDWDGNIIEKEPIKGYIKHS